MLSNLIGKLNKELHYKMGETKALAGEAEDYDFVIFVTNGEHTTIKFMGIEIWNTQKMEKYEAPSVEEQLALFEGERFENHIRQLIQDELNALGRIEMV